MKNINQWKGQEKKVIEMKTIIHLIFTKDTNYSIELNDL